MKKPKLFSDQLREAIDASGMSRYAICQKLGYPQAGLSRFMTGKAGLSVETIDMICDLIGARVILEREPKPAPKSRKAGK